MKLVLAFANPDFQNMPYPELVASVYFLWDIKDKNKKASELYNKLLPVLQERTVNIAIQAMREEIVSIVEYILDEYTYSWSDEEGEHVKPQDVVDLGNDFFIYISDLSKIFNTDKRGCIGRLLRGNLFVEHNIHKTLEENFRHPEDFVSFFECIRPQSAYGGKGWLEIAKTVAALDEAPLGKIMLIFDKLIHIQHHTGNLFNKFGFSDKLNAVIYAKAKGPVHLGKFLPQGTIKMLWQKYYGKIKTTKYHLNNMPLHIALPLVELNVDKYNGRVKCLLSKDENLSTCIKKAIQVAKKHFNSAKVKKLFKPILEDECVQSLLDSRFAYHIIERSGSPLFLLVTSPWVFTRRCKSTRRYNLDKLVLQAFGRKVYDYLNMTKTLASSAAEDIAIPYLIAEGVIEQESMTTKQVVAYRVLCKTDDTKKAARLIVALNFPNLKAQSREQLEKKLKVIIARLKRTKRSDVNAATLYTIAFLMGLASSAGMATFDVMPGGMLVGMFSNAIMALVASKIELRIDKKLERGEITKDQYRRYKRAMSSFYKGSIVGDAVGLANLSRFLVKNKLLTRKEALTLTKVLREMLIPAAREAGKSKYVTIPLDLIMRTVSLLKVFGLSDKLRPVVTKAVMTARKVGNTLKRLRS